MKISTPLVAGLALALIGLLSTARAEVSPFRVRVEQVSKSDSEKHSKTQTRSLKIFVSNSSKESAELIAKYIIFGRDVKGNEVVKLDEGAKAVSSKPLGTEMAESAAVTSVSQEAHSTGSSKGGKGGGAKKTEASGTKILGYSVQVFQGEKMVAEAYDPLSMKEQVTKAYPAKKPEPKK